MKTLLKFLCPLLLIFGLVTPVRAVTPEEQTIIHSCTYGQDVNLTDYQMTKDDLDVLFTRLCDEGKLPWYTTGEYQCTYDSASGQVYSFTPTNLPNNYDRALYEEKLAEVMAACIHPGMTPEEIALSVHDRLILMARYDETLQANTAYDLLIDGTSVCKGYTTLYRDILNRAGIPCISVSSESMEHTWNLVQLNGQWYHADLTWNDPTPDVYGVVNHGFFLLTDDQISAGKPPHYNWPPVVACSDDRYRLAYWRDLTSPVLFPGDGNAYYLIEEDLAYRLVRRDLATGEETLMFRESSPTVLTIGDGGSYTYKHTGLSYWQGRLYFGTLNKVHSMDLEGNMRTEYTFDTDATGRFIYSCYVQDDTLFMTTLTPEGDPRAMEVALEPSEEELAQRHTHVYTRTKEPATCTVPGRVISTCECGLRLESSPSLLPHTYTPAEPTETHTREACSACGAIRITNTITKAVVPVVKDVLLEQPPTNYKPLLIIIPCGLLLLSTVLVAMKRR